ncbi:MAG TPA: double zinc ribbon domain-containing protein [Lachnospiraceae bacterium]|nr:double zinc ribbon domain-containing protein [Lachnospiraceae bacterium]
MNLLDILYPKRCPVCGDIIIPKGNDICDKCMDIFQIINDPKCMKCGKPLLQDEQEFCFDCSIRKHSYNKGMALWVYDSNVKRSIAEYKYHSRREYSEYYIKQLLSNYSEDIVRINPDALIPIPLHKTKLKERGFNQATILANGIGKALHINVVDNYLIRKRKTLPQKGLNEVERYKNLEEAFAVNSY